jgi:hypothetical protein
MFISRESLTIDFPVFLFLSYHIAEKIKERGTIMALFKIEKGLAANLKTNRPDAVEGYCYFTTDDGKFYIDIATGTAKTPAENNGVLAGSTRMPINSYMSDWATRAKADVDGNDITSTYGT